jgi:hypothetical protein
MSSTCIKINIHVSTSFQDFCTNVGLESTFECTPNIGYLKIYIQAQS